MTSIHRRDLERDSGVDCVTLPLIHPQIDISFRGVREEDVVIVGNVIQVCEGRLLVARDLKRGVTYRLACVTDFVFRVNCRDAERFASRQGQLEPTLAVGLIFIRLAFDAFFCDQDCRLLQAAARRSRGPVFREQDRSLHND